MTKEFRRIIYELIDACLSIDNPLIDNKSLCKKLKARLSNRWTHSNSKDEIVNIYETGAGPVNQGMASRERRKKGLCHH